MNLNISRTELADKLNNLIKIIPELNNINFFVKKTGKNTLYLKKDKDNYIIDNKRIILIDRLKIKEGKPINKLLYNDQMIIALINECLNGTTKAYTDFSSDDELNLRSLIEEYFEETKLLIGENKVKLIIKNKEIIISEDDSLKIAIFITNNNISSALDLIERYIKEQTKFKILKYLKKGITKEIEKNVIQLFENKAKEYFELYVKPFDLLLNEDKKNFFKFLNNEKYTINVNTDLIKDLQFLDRLKNNYFIIDKSITNISITNDLLTIAFTSLKNDKPIININKEFIKKIDVTKSFLNEYKFIDVLVCFYNCFNKEKNEYINKVHKVIVESKLSAVIDEKKIIDKVSIQRIDLIENILFIDGIIFSFDELINGYDNILNMIKERFNIILKEVKKQCHDKKDKIKSTLTDAENNYIINLIKEFPKKGITTYVEILHGDNNAKMSKYDYNTSESYGKLKSLKGITIENKIDELVKCKYINCCSFNASFGTYQGYVISSNIDEIINDMNDTIDKTIKESIPKEVNIKQFLNYLITLDDIEDYLNKVNIIDFKHEDILNIINFITNQRNLYKTCEKTFIDKLCGIIPEKYSSLFLMNSNLEKGVVSKTLKEIAITIKEGVKVG